MGHKLYFTVCEMTGMLYFFLSLKSRNYFLDLLIHSTVLHQRFGSVSYKKQISFIDTPIVILFIFASCCLNTFFGLLNVPFNTFAIVVIISFLGNSRVCTFKHHILVFDSWDMTNPNCLWQMGGRMCFNSVTQAASRWGEHTLMQGVDGCYYPDYRSR